MRLQKSADGTLVFRRCKGAGGVDQASAGLEHAGDLRKNFLLAGCTVGDCVLAPVRDGGFFFAEHAFAGTGGIHQNAVKAVVEVLGQLLRRFVQNKSVGDTHALDVSGQYFCPGRVDLVADQQTLTLHSGSDLGGFAAGGGAQIQYSFAGLRVQQTDRSHGTGFLEIIDTGLVIRVQTRSGLRVIIIAVGSPGNRFQAEGQLGEVFRL